MQTRAPGFRAAGRDIRELRLRRAVAGAFREDRGGGPAFADRNARIALGETARGERRGAGGIERGGLRRKQRDERTSGPRQSPPHPPTPPWSGTATKVGAVASLVTVLTASWTETWTMVMVRTWGTGPCPRSPWRRSRSGSTPGRRRRRLPELAREAAPRATRLWRGTAGAYS